MTAATGYAHSDAIVGTQWLADSLRDPSLRVFDCTTHLRHEAGTGRPYRVESGRAPGSSSARRRSGPPSATRAPAR